MGLASFFLRYFCLSISILLFLSSFSYEDLIALSFLLDCTIYAVFLSSEMGENEVSSHSCLLYVASVFLVVSDGEGFSDALLVGSKLESKKEPGLEWLMLAAFTAEEADSNGWLSSDSKKFFSRT